MGTFASAGMDPIEMQRPWPAALLAPYIERRLADILPSGGLRVALNETAPNQDSKCSCHRPDGKPEEWEHSGTHLSRSHCGGLVLTARSRQLVGCDMELCADRSEVSWRGLLGEHWLSLAQMMATESNIPMQDAATQVWTLKESLRKCGALFDQHLQIQTRTSDGWTVLSSEGLHAATFRASIQGSEDEIAFAFLTRKPS
jgi:enediyne polyketide synthase